MKEGFTFIYVPPSANDIVLLKTKTHLYHGASSDQIGNALTQFLLACGYSKDVVKNGLEYALESLKEF